jgi:hypothetical protein
MRDYPTLHLTQRNNDFIAVLQFTVTVGYLFTNFLLKLYVVIENKVQ